MKILIFDAGPIINLSMNGLLYILEELKKNFDGKFIITSQVKSEIIDKPIKIQRFEFEALNVKELFNEKILESLSSLNIDENLLQKKTTELMNKANGFIKFQGEKVKIVSEGEISCLVLSEELSKKGIENIIAIDERTTRILSENPKELKEIIERKMHKEVFLTTNNFSEFKKFNFIRSSEIVYVAYKKGLIKTKDPKTLEAVLYAVKFKGCSISFEEINVLKRL